MPTELLVQQNQLVYTANFARPPWHLWGQGGTILDGLFSAFSPFGVTLADIRSESVSQNPIGQVVVVNIGANGFHKFRFDRLESTFFNFTNELFTQLPVVLEASTRWIRKALPSCEFASHQCAYSSHSYLKGMNADELLTFASTVMKSGGKGRGTGVIFHWELPEQKWTTQLVIDRSIVLSEGVYILFSVLVKEDRINYPNLVQEARAYLDAVLGEIGLRFP